MGEAIARVGPRDDSFNLRVPFGPSPHEAGVEATLEEVRQHTRTRYARPREEVAAEYLRAIGLEPAPEAPPTSWPTAEPAPSENAAAPVPQAPPSGPVPAREADDPVSSPREPAMQEASGETEPTSTDLAAPVPVDRKAGPIKEKLIRGAVPLGYSYVEEQEVLEGAGRVDLVFQRGAVTVACEICATTPARHEAGNLLKCLRAGFARMALVCDQTLKRHRIGELLAQEAGEADRSRVRLLTASQFLAWLAELAGDTPAPPALHLGSLSTEEQAAARAKMLGEIAAKRRAAQQGRKP